MELNFSTLLDLVEGRLSDREKDAVLMAMLKDTVWFRALRGIREVQATLPEGVTLAQYFHNASERIAEGIAKRQ